MARDEQYIFYHKFRRRDNHLFPRRDNRVDVSLIRHYIMRPNEMYILPPFHLELTFLLSREKSRTFHPLSPFHLELTVFFIIQEEVANFSCAKIKFFTITLRLGIKKLDQRFKLLHIKYYIEKLIVMAKTISCWKIFFRNVIDFAEYS